MFFPFSLPINNPSPSQIVEQSQISTQIIEQSESSQTSPLVADSPVSSQTDLLVADSSVSSQTNPLVTDSAVSSQTCLLETDSQINSQLLNRQKSGEFTKIKETGNYRYLQQQLCNTDLFEHIEGNNFAKMIPTPFGMVNVFFRYCQNDDRYVRCVFNAGSYEKVVRFLNPNIGPEETKKIFEIILNYMQFEVKGTDSLIDNLKKCLSSMHKTYSNLFRYIADKDQGTTTSKTTPETKSKTTPETKSKTKSKTTSKTSKLRRAKQTKIEAETAPFKEFLPPEGKLMKTLAHLCAFSAICDPCYGYGETGGAEIRSALRSAQKSKTLSFNFFLDEKQYPYGQKKAFKTTREHNAGKKINPHLSHINSNMSGIEGTTEHQESNDLEFSLPKSNDLEFSLIEPSEN